MTRCHECKYWVESKAGEKGDCRKSKPNVFLVTAPGAMGQAVTKTISAWPVTSPKQGCGDGVAGEQIVHESIAAKIAGGFV